MDFWNGKKVLVTGHTGFKGSWLCLWLQNLGADVTGYALSPPTNPSLFDVARVSEGMKSVIGDIRDLDRLLAVFDECRPEIVFHLAAQPLVRESYADPVGTYSTNVMGTVHVLDALRGLDCVRVAVMVTTDKIYRNNEWPWPYREEDALGGYDPYSASKAASEIVISSFRDAFLSDQGISVASARAGNVIGGGDWSQDRLIPDAVRAWQSGQPLEIRRPHSIRPWQHVLEPLAGYLLLAEKLWQHPALAGAYNFGPETGEAATVRDVVELARQAFGGGKVHYADGSEGPHEAGWLALEIAKSRHMLGFEPRWNLHASIRRTMEWYQKQRNGEDARALCEAEIAAYEAEL